MYSIVRAEGTSGEDPGGMRAMAATAIAAPAMPPGAVSPRPRRRTVYDGQALPLLWLIVIT